jgi:hypothetical protein
MDSKESPAAAAYVPDKVQGDGVVVLLSGFHGLKLDAPDFVVNQACAGADGCAVFFDPPLAAFEPPDWLVGDGVQGPFPLDFLRLACF